MAGIRQDFFTNSSQTKNEERKHNITSSNLTSASNQHSSQQQQNKKQQMTNTVMTPTSQEKPRKQVKSSLHLEVSEFSPAGQMSIDQLIKLVLNLQVEVKKLRKENTKLTDLINMDFKINWIQEWLTRRGKLTPYETTNTKSSTKRTFKFRKGKKKCSDGEHPPKLKKLIQSTKLKITHYGN